LADVSTGAADDRSADISIGAEPRLTQLAANLDLGQIVDP
jgi:hypothetical protein